MTPGFYWVTFQNLRLPAALVIEHSPLRSSPLLSWVLPGLCSSVDAEHISDPVPCIEPEREPTKEQSERVTCSTCGKMKLAGDTPDAFRCTCI